jgi:hypothetical protein
LQWQVQYEYVLTVPYATPTKPAGGDPDVIWSRTGVGVGLGEIVGLGDGRGSPVTSSHQYVLPGVAANVVELPGKFATLPLMPVSNSVSKRAPVVLSKVSSASNPLL